MTLSLEAITFLIPSAIATTLGFATSRGFTSLP